ERDRGEERRGEEREGESREKSSARKTRRRRRWRLRWRRCSVAAAAGCRRSSRDRLRPPLLRASGAIPCHSTGLCPSEAVEFSQQEQKLVRMEQFGSKRSFYNPFNPGPPDGMPWSALGITGAISIAYMATHLARSLWKRYTEEDDYITRLVNDK
ncbi:unnamed protein product, partial [Urochloa humidicola]